jgi:hypothetical protein
MPVCAGFFWAKLDALKRMRWRDQQWTKTDTLKWRIRCNGKLGLVIGACSHVF